MDVERFRRDGFVHLPAFVDRGGVADLTAAVEAAEERDPGENPLSLATMRFASNLFYASATLRAFLCSAPVLGAVRPLVGDDVWVRWDQAVWKGPDAPMFPWHQDNGYTGLDAEHVQLWLALTPSHADNGGLVVQPGGHRSVLQHRWVGGHVEIDEPSTARVIVAEPGDAVVFSSFLPHSTTPNTTDGTRLAYVAEFLPLAVADGGVRPPHFVAVRGGEPCGELVDLSTTWELDVPAPDGRSGPDRGDVVAGRRFSERLRRSRRRRS